MASHLSGIVTPMILSLGLAIWGPLPLLIFGTMSIIAAVLALFFPETLGQPLQETLEESENFGKSRLISKYMSFVEVSLKVPSPFVHAILQEIIQFRNMSSEKRVPVFEISRHFDGNLFNTFKEGSQDKATLPI